MQDLHFESAESGASLTYPQQAGTVRKNGFLVIKGRPCKVGTASRHCCYFQITQPAQLQPLLMQCAAPARGGPGPDPVCMQCLLDWSLAMTSLVSAWTSALCSALLADVWASGL